MLVHYVQAFCTCFVDKGAKSMVHERLADYIKANGITQAHICRKTGLSANAVSQILKGEQRLPVDDYVAICAAINVEPSRFLG